MTTKAKKAKKRKASRAAVLTRTAKPVSLPTPWDHGADGQANRKGLVVEERGEVDAKTGKVTNPNRVTGVRRIDLLEYWHKRGTISTAGFNAASALRDAFEATQKSPPCLPDNDRVQASPKPDHAVTIQIDRISRYHRLRKFVDPTDAQIIDRCVLGGEHPGKVYGALRTRQGFDDLRDALDRMADRMSGR
ncbi:hypothetical protein Shpa_57 [Paracoccus phage Shpa]|uniref:Uncharacterized protein n=1 Tax=Paracoccus phage Shpa TaxID=1647282 RepID=A0A0U2C0Z0_9CAUD|nr:hypothetical protein FDG85_gp56 [Paracoccus phage Shpa]AKG94567.1 hypothetical protein Shpa_57 [Paracoccus phage Shpa]